MPPHPTSDPDLNAVLRALVDGANAALSDEWEAAGE
jgi:hypothetical protein